jgi:hypothetical protein
MLRPLAVLAALASLAAASPALAQGWRGDRVVDLVNADVSFVTSAVVDGLRYRAVVLETRQEDALLLLEVGDAVGHHRRRPWAQVRVTTLDLGRARVDALNASEFRDLRFGRAALLFETTLRHGDVRCRVPLRRFDARDRAVAATCEDLRPPQPVHVVETRPGAVLPPHGAPHPAPGLGRPPTVEARPAFEAEVVGRCGQAVMGQSVEACIRAARPHGPQAPEVINACDRVGIGDSAVISCLETARPGYLRNPDLILACERSTVGQQALLGCLRTASESRFDPLPVVHECHEATVGNEAFQRCLVAALR